MYARPSTRSLIGYTGLEVVSDEGSSSYSNQATNSCDYSSQGIQRGIVMDDLPSYHGLSVSDMQLSSDVSRAGYSHHQVRWTNYSPP